MSERIDRKKVISSLLTIGAAGALLVGATMAFFSSQATSEDNTFAAGELVLSLDDENEATPSASVSQSISADNFAPGDSTDGWISLHNSGNIDIAEVLFTANSSETNDPSPSSNMKTVLNLKVRVASAGDPTSTTCAGGSNITSAIDSQVGDGAAPLTLQEFDNGTDVYDAILGGSAEIGPGETRNICLTVTFDSGAGNQYQGDAISTDFVFTANQHPSQ